jgi:hypothetical protein
MPVTLATWEADIQTTAVPGQPRQKVCAIPSQPISGCSGAHLSSPAVWETKIKRITALGLPWKNKFVKILITKEKIWAW